MDHTVSLAIQKCIDVCHSCALVCKQTIIHCIHEGRKHSDPEHLEQLISCIVICQASVDAGILEVLIHKIPAPKSSDYSEELFDVMAAHSPYMDQMCVICVDICESCAESCDQFDNKEMKKCANECRACEKVCRDMTQ